MAGFGDLNTGSSTLVPDQTTGVIPSREGYGTFSGADIQVYVHMPYNPKAYQAAQNELESLKARQDELVQEIQEIEQSQGNWSGETVDRFYSLKSQLSIISGMVVRVEDELAIGTNMPSLKPLGSIQTISWSLYRDIQPVRTLGSVYPRGFVKGPRSIGGSMIFTIIYKHVFQDIMDSIRGHYSTGTSDIDKYHYSTVLIDQMPPLDITIIGANEYGAVCHMGLWGVQFFQEGGTFSIEDIFSEQQVQYVSRDFDPLRPIGTRKIEGNGVGQEWTKTASQLNNENIRHIIRRNPFI
jgi:hypothetical protein